MPSSLAVSRSTSGSGGELVVAWMAGLHEKNAFYVVRKGDVVGVYENLTDCVAEAGSSGHSPAVTVLKGYNLRGGQTEEYLKSYGLKNALYSVHASALENGIFGQLFPSGIQQIIPPAGASTGHSSSRKVKRTAEFLRPEADVNGFAMTSSLTSSKKRAKLEGFFPSQAISPDYPSCTLEFDGAAKGNPGPAGAGAIVRSEDGSVLREGVGRATNNAAEYRALILGLRYALEKGYQQIRVRGDSKLVCMQVQGLWKMKSENLANLHKLAKELRDRFTCFQINHVLREFNAEADALANKAILLKDGEIEVDCVRK
ncbi:hypothetical protein MLD38_022490 [Melastoma candidum]|uniref:Uncharacterized protein n=1 Tax=Melastoma candidum TaxID=119954 RepID=A0ACB9QMT3_9MYRT|nr:hypothetical protein MLD38_022490 [Melastoma candidum]